MSLSSEHLRKSSSCSDTIRNLLFYNQRKTHRIPFNEVSYPSSLSASPILALVSKPQCLSIAYLTIVVSR